jgi:hypothetical protein
MGGTEGALNRAGTVQRPPAAPRGAVVALVALSPPGGPLRRCGEPWRAPLPSWGVLAPPGGVWGVLGPVGGMAAQTPATDHPRHPPADHWQESTGTDQLAHIGDQ